MSDEESKEEYVPNEVPLMERIKLLAISGFFIVYGSYGLWINDISLGRGRRRWTWLTGAERRRDPIHFHDEAAILLYIGFVLVSASFISEVVDHYDKRNNEHKYHKFAKFTLWPGVVFCVLAFFFR